MELHVVSSEGIPEGCVLSVRAGSTRRQAPVTADRPFRFPDTLAEAMPFKVDVLEPVASARLILRAGEERRTDCQYTIPLESSAAEAEGNAEVKQETDKQVAAEAAAMSVTIAVSPLDDAKREEPKDDSADASRPGSSSKAKQPSPGSSASSRRGLVNASREYLDKHNLVEFTQLLVQSVIKEQPDKPYAFMAKQFYFPDPEPRQQRPNSSSATPGAPPLTYAQVVKQPGVVGQQTMKTQATAGVGEASANRS